VEIRPVSAQGRDNARIFRFDFQTSTVIASEAKQSIAPLAEAWIASSLTLLAITENFNVRHSGMRPLGAGPESITTIVSMDSGFALRAPRNDE
jgi:hypothetical protein